MLNAETLDEITRKIGDAIQASPAKALQKTVRAMLQSNLAPRPGDATSSHCKRTCVARASFEGDGARVAELEARRPKLAARRLGPARDVATPKLRARAADARRRPSQPRMSGFDAPPVTDEVHLAGGLPAPSRQSAGDGGQKAATGARSVLQNAQFDFPARKSRDLAPADCRKTRAVRFADRFGDSGAGPGSPPPRSQCSSLRASSH
jgi:hypothetical protein